MSKLNRIQHEIKQLEGGKFQKLCDSYLFKKRGLSNITSLGSMDRTDKTTKGIPDAYYHNQDTDKYTLIMYGTRKDSKTKILKDIKDAIMKSKIRPMYIEEIICCHTSSNIDVDQDKSLREYAGAIKLTLIGIDTLSQDLLNFNYQDIVKDHLGIQKSTDQVWNLKSFIELHDKSKTNAQLTTKYIDKNQLVYKMIEKLNENQILILSGIPGVGKTKLAIEILKKLEIENNVISVKSNSLPVYQDIKDALNESKINYLLLDDANTVSNLEPIVNILQLKPFERNLKIIMTVRDYAFSDIKKYIMEYTSFHQNIEKMSDKNLEELIISIVNPLTVQLRKILDISNNNPRIAVLAANMLKNKDLDFVSSKKMIMDFYYSKVLEDNSLSNEELFSIFILSFCNKINLSQRERLESLLKVFDIDFITFHQSLLQLHEKELCDIYFDKAAKVSDQSLSDFIIVRFIFTNRTIKIREIFKALYPQFQNEIISALNIVNNFTVTHEWKNYLKEEIKYVYSDVISDKYKTDFLIQYGKIIPTQSLKYSNYAIKTSRAEVFECNQKEFEKKKRNIIVNDEIVQILSSLLDSDEYKKSIILLLKYLKKNQKMIFEVFSAIKDNVNIDLNSVNYLHKRSTLIELFLEENYIDEISGLLMVNICEEFLKPSTETLTTNGNHGVLTRYKLVDSQYLIKLHESIFNLLSVIYNFEYANVNLFIDRLLLDYPIHKVDKDYQNTVKADLKIIYDLFLNDTNNLTLRREAILYKISLASKKHSLIIKKWDKYKPTEHQKALHP
ncbi:hypothetical protein [Staphylococcus sp. IVB6227]|uniref:nSTAND3 domain-containing NTPase n=1 Tax=Staphylococcus sp. IVB6227 TaxID=2989768 RepID=UPI0021D37B66|nr:hypothetical protein [Staphylococcus sp. IVB6227]UXR78459.1 hypothetical protein MUA92_00675 [Staphylococcus sp. IVB6227]